MNNKSNMENLIEKMTMQENMNHLCDRDKKIILLYYYWGYKDEEIGSLLGLRQQTVNYHRKKTIKQLKSFFDAATFSIS